MIDFFGWALHDGAQDAARIGYAPLPEPLVAQVSDDWARTFGTGFRFEQR